MPLDVPIVRLDPDLPLPSYARPGDAGIDLLARHTVTLDPAGGRALVPTGVAVAIPAGHGGFVLPRSGLALRHGVTLLNTPGLIDAGYRDELKVLMVNTDPANRYVVERGDRKVAQRIVHGPHEGPRGNRVQEGPHVGGFRSLVHVRLTRSEPGTSAP